MNTQDMRKARQSAGYLLTEALVYISVVMVILGIGYAAMYRSTRYSLNLRRSAEDIAKALSVGAVSIPTTIDGMGKIELDEHWLVGPLFRAYGVICVHRGRPDRKAIRAALDGLAEGRMLALAPEGRQAVDGKLEEGTEGAAFLAMKTGAIIVPVAMTGKENENIYNRKCWRRARVTLSVGKPFKLQEQADRQKMMREGTEQIMEALASLLPESYRGNYKVEQT